MSDILLNLDTVLPQPAQKSSEGNKKHQRFVKRRQFLERKGFLKQKQLPAQPPLPRRDASLGCRGGPGRAKKKQRTEAEEGTEASPEAGPPCRPKTLAKESSGSGAVDPGRWTSSSSVAASASRKTGSGAGKPNGTLCSRGDVPRVGRLDEFKSGLPDAPVVAKPSKMVAIDCEMVGTGPGGRNSDLARCSVVGYYGDVMYDKYIRPLSPITNYRTRWSGIRQHHMRDAVPFKLAQKEILKLLSGKVVIGHAIHNDFKALKYFHPKSLTRDTSKIPLLNRKAGFPENESASLKRLTKQLLHRDIQVGHNGHSSVEDARATMELYKVIEVEWERHLATSPLQDGPPGTTT
ncbi:interferon-stimulated 20 kDa exonuclease-like 2 [Pseudonaja textilis]|uniref:interferon-stimulated 20 kDa exonuclease-like 2 n=1 Tax=Pseudonaja textilis TaxID=8673 RepID=UPI000EA90A24|nr:interferon-stimulated 20 kDa exonuclease-like 2 [Pseudonaja textilis]XP_026575944.1 interferon-stimulated 20 kDa exonuclease-like 2 [Pseudonaja textilis]XP_026575945.1 interferon-stimulated 20 kDa exonuclease-like 2 [Pseudonaja textilis]